MDRRDILKYAAMLTGAAIYAPLTTSLLTGCSKQAETTMATAGVKTKGQFFDDKTFDLLTQIMDVILPKTDTPSASEVNVNGIMDNMFAKVFKPHYQKEFLKKFAALEGVLTKSGFHNASPAKQLEIIQLLESTPADQQTEVYRAYIDIKQQTVSYYLSTEEIAENHLNYLPVPGGYTPSISVKEVGGKAWAE